MFFAGITTIFLLFVIIVAFAVFLSKPPQSSFEVAFNKPKVDINIKVFDSEQFKNLVPFEGMKTQFEYVALAKSNKKVSGFVAAASEDEAREILEGLELKVVTIKEAKTGRENPFMPYYQIISTTR